MTTLNTSEYTGTYELDFERPLIQLERQIAELEAQAEEAGVDIGTEVRKLRQSHTDTLRKIYKGLSAWNTVKVARHPGRPQTIDFIRYFVAVFVVRQFTVAWVLYDFEYHVVSGKLTPFLLAPADPTWRFFLIHTGEQLCRLPFVVILVAFALVLYPEALWGTQERPGVWAPEAHRVALAVVATGLAFAMRFYLQYAMAMLAFWVERVSALEPITMAPYVFLSGMIFPISLLQTQYGSWAYELALLTPFPWMAWFPASLVLPGLAGDVPVVRGFVTQLAWVAAFVAVQRFLWRRGLRQYSAMGA